MSDIKLFRTNAGDVTPLSAGTAVLEKALQNLFETNLEALLGVRFLASEFRAGAGRMDTLGIDENGSPVIIEYKRSSNDNVINQGLFYLNWLMGHRKDFEWLVLKLFGEKEAEQVDWSGPRLICIANDFNKYDEHAVQQMGRNVSLIRYRLFSGDLLLLEQLTSTTGKTTVPALVDEAAPAATKKRGPTFTENLSKATPSTKLRFETLHDYLTSFGDDVTVKTTDFYRAYSRIKNFACVEVRSKADKILVYLKVDPDTVIPDSGFLRDVRAIGHYGTGDLEVTITADDDLEKAKALIMRSYEES